MGRIHERKSQAEFTALAIFDFDDTLFRSPTPPGKTHEERAKWWRTPASLLPPHVPERPGSEWWNSSVVQAARNAIRNDETYAVVVTGRREGSALRGRLEDLLAYAGLRFDEVAMNPAQTGPAGPYKHSKTKQLLTEFPGVQVVEVWDDLADNVNAIESAARSMGRQVEPHFVSLREEIRYLTGKLRFDLAR